MSGEAAAQERERECCGMCRFWAGNVQKDYWSGQASCRRYPPTFIGKHSYGGTVPKWPEVSGHQWCGEYHPADTAGNEA